MEVNKEENLDLQTQINILTAIVVGRECRDTMRMCPNSIIGMRTVYEGKKYSLNTNGDIKYIGEYDEAVGF